MKLEKFPSRIVKRVEKSKIPQQQARKMTEVDLLLRRDEIRDRKSQLFFLINLKIAFMLIAIQTRFHSSFYPSTTFLSVFIIKIPAWPCLLRLNSVSVTTSLPHPNTLKSRFCLLIKRIARADDFVFNFQITIIVVTITDSVQCRGAGGDVVDLSQRCAIITNNFGWKIILSMKLYDNLFITIIHFT